MKTGPSGGVEQSVGVNVPTVDLTSDRGGRPTAWCISNNDDQRIYNGANSYTTTGVSGSAGDIVGVEIDRANTTIKFYVNGTLRGTQTNLNTTTDLYPWVGTGGSTSDTLGWDLNFGQNGTFNGLVTAQGESDATGYGNFYYDEAGSCKALCAGNLPVAAEVDPAQTDDDYPQKLFGAKLYTGNGGTNAITGLGFKPDVVWGKSRSNTQDHFLADSTNGTGKDLIPNSNVAQQTENGVTSFDTDGWTMGSIYNATAYTYVAWNWRANGGTTSTNTQGDITSTVQVDPSGCFSIVTYTGESATRTIGHGLSATPTTIWVKSIASSYGWANYFKDNGLNKLAFNSLGNDTGASTLWGNTHPTSSVFSVGDGSETGKSTTYVAYCFAPCEGYISIGSYVANGSSTNNTFVYTGFRPAFLLVKGLVTGAAWTLIDNKRDGYNPTPESLEPNSAGASYTSAAPFADLLSNGFKVRTNNAVMGSTSYGPYVYVAMAETPFKYATAR
jgi:hypothetical protein